MKIKLDENIAVSSKAHSSALGLDVDTVLDEDLGGHSDVDVWAAAQAEGRFLITQDLDVAWLSSPDVTSWARCFIVATPTKVRVIRVTDPTGGESTT